MGMGSAGEISTSLTMDLTIGPTGTLILAPTRERWQTPLSAYPTAILFVIFSILSLFATLTHILESRWVHSKDWISISLPPILFVNTAILLVSSVTVELARRSLRRNTRKGCTRWLCVTLVLGLGFVAGQLAAWRELDFEGALRCF